MADSPCAICDTFWRLYTRAVENLHELVRKHGDMRDRGDSGSCEMLSYEIAIAESTLRAIRVERRRHDRIRHRPQQPEAKKPQGREPAEGGEGRAMPPGAS